MSFAERLKSLRKLLNATQATIADFLNITVRQYQLYEAGKSYPSFSGLLALADYFDVSLDFLVGRRKYQRRVVVCKQENGVKTNIGARLKELREKAGLTQVELARFIGVAQNTYANYENENRSVPDDIKLKLADFFGISLDFLIGRTDEPCNVFFHSESIKKTGGLKVQEYQELSREIIREYGDNLLVKVTGLYLEEYKTTFFERWTNRAAYDRRQKADGNQIFCANLAETEETVLANWNKFIADRQAQYKDIPKYTCAECGNLSSNEFLDRCCLCGGQIPNHE